MTRIDTEVGQSSLGPADADVAWINTMGALGATAVPSAAERAKVESIKTRSLSTRLTALCDAILARA